MLLLVLGGRIAYGQDVDPVAEASGWRAQTFASTQAVASAAPTSHVAHSGKRSLAVSVRLNGAVAAFRQGEVYVDLRYYPPPDVDAPADFAGRAITAWVFAPPGLEGPRHNPNGVRLFVKDAKWHSEYGAWTHLRPGQWNQVQFTPAAEAPPTGFRDAGFDPHQVIALGLSVATGGGSSARYVGPLYLDDVSWVGSAAPRYGFEE